MATFYIASSKELANWASDVGLTKHVYKIGVTDDKAEAVIATLNEAQLAGQGDWKLAKKQDGVEFDEETAIARIAAREKLVDGNYYPRIKQAPGIFKVKLANVESQILMQQTLRGETPHVVKIKTADILDYLVSIVTQKNAGW